MTKPRELQVISPMNAYSRGDGMSDTMRAIIGVLLFLGVSAVLVLVFAFVGWLV